MTWLSLRSEADGADDVLLNPDTGATITLSQHPSQADRRYRVRYAYPGGRTLVMATSDGPDGWSQCYEFMNALRRTLGALAFEMEFYDPAEMGGPVLPLDNNKPRV